MQTQTTPHQPATQVDMLWLDPVFGWLGNQEPVLSALVAIAALLGIGAGIGRKVRRALAHRSPPREARLWQRFADHLESQLRRLDEREEWRDYRFARLEAEVEAEGRRRTVLLGRAGGRGDGLRRERSLLNALKRSSERLIVLQGDPGSGKSVSLRKVAIDLAREAMHNFRKDQRIPLYINLKELRPVRRPVDAAAIREYVLASLNQANSRDVDRFLEAEFDQGLANGRWLFLFDSFDEIPDVLSADQMDETVEEYADALYDFLHGMNTSRGVIASREFRGPYRFGWPRFTIQRLTEAQRRELIKRADLSPVAEQAVLGGIATADPTVARLAENPMLLGLLCEHVRDTGEFPSVSHIVFETFVASRLSRDAERVQRRFEISPESLRATAEEVAFHLTADEKLGLSPTRSQLSMSMDTVVYGGGLDRRLDALEYIKLARAPEGTATGGDRQFTFAHRRFQEYFATCVIIREPGRVSRAALLLDGRWREATVTMLQTQPVETVARLVAEAEHRLAAGIAQLPPERPDGFFPWPADSQYLLRLLEGGTANRPNLAPATLRDKVGMLLRRAWDEGRRVDRKWAIEVSALANESTTTRIIESVFDTDSKLLQQVAYRQAGRLRVLPESLALHIRRVLAGQALQGRMLRDWRAVTAEVRRFTDPSPWLNIVRLLRWAPLIEMYFLGALLLTSQVAGAARVVILLTITVAVYVFGGVFRSRISKRQEDTGYTSTSRSATVAGFPLLFATGLYAGSATVVVGVEAWSAMQAGAAGYRTMLLAIAIIAGAYATVWLPAVSVATITGHAVSRHGWPLLPVTVVPIVWRQLRQRAWQVRWPFRRDWLAFSVRILALMVLMPWLLFVALLDARRVRRLRHRVLTTYDVQALLSRLQDYGAVTLLTRLVSRQELRCELDAVEFLEELAAKADSYDSQEQGPRFLPNLRQPDWVGSPHLLPEGALDQIALISEARLRAVSQATVPVASTEPGAAA